MNLSNSSGDAVVVIGAGLAGLNSAWFLRKAGFAVHVVEKRADAGLETSFANAGMMTPSMSEPWNAPGVHWDLLRWLGRKEAPMLLRPAALHHYIGWGLKFLAHSRPAPHLAAMEANFALSALSMSAVRELRRECRLDYALGTRGTIKIYRDRASFDSARAAAGLLRGKGLAFDVLDATGAVRQEPQLAEIEPLLTGAIHYPGDETGDAHRYCRELKRELAARGVSFSFGAGVRRIVVERGAVRAVETGAGEIATNRVVLAAAARSPELAAPLGVALNIRPVKGYSISAPVPPERRLSMAVIDDSLHTAATPLGGILRVAGTAEFAGWDAALDPDRLENLWRFLKALSPAMHAAADRASATSWCGFRPMAADGRAYIGATPIPGLFVNCGHGHLGWTQSAGSGQLLAQLISGETPAIDPAPYSAGR